MPFVSSTSTAAFSITRPKCGVVDIVLKVSQSLAQTHQLGLCFSVVHVYAFKQRLSRDLWLWALLDANCLLTVHFVAPFEFPKHRKNLGLLNAEANCVNCPQLTIHCMPVWKGFEVYCSPPFNMTRLVTQESVVLSECRILHNFTFWSQMSYYQEFQETDLFSM